jgi:hypothetical protein
VATMDGYAVVEKSGASARIAEQGPGKEG